MGPVTGKHVSIKIDGVSKSIPVDSFFAPAGFGAKGFMSPPKTLPKGIGTDREIHRYINETRKDPLALAMQQFQEIVDIQAGN